MGGIENSSLSKLLRSLNNWYCAVMDIKLKQGGMQRKNTAFESYKFI